jgi:hypothetical protein
MTHLYTHNCTDRIYVENYVYLILQKVSSSLGGGEYATHVGKDDILPASEHGRHFFITERGYFGLVPQSAKEGDLLVIFHGGRVPFCIRPIVGSADGYHHLIGDCYVNGAMEEEQVIEKKFLEKKEMFNII